MVSRKIKIKPNKRIVMKKISFLLICCVALLTAAKAQDSTATAKEEPAGPTFTRATFNSSRVINLQSTEIVSKHALEFMIQHHFTYIWNKGAGKQNLAQLFGLNSGVAHTYLSFSYSPLSYLNVGLAAAGSSVYEGWAKVRLIRQQTGKRNIPVTVAFYSMMNVNTASDPSIEFSSNRYAFLNQLLIARKFSPRFSMELAPSWVHFNIVPYGINNSNEVFSIAVAGKYKLKTKLNLTFEYARQLNMYKNIISKSGTIINYQPNLLAAGLEIKTMGHLFQFYIGSTTSSSNIDQLARNNSSIKDGNFAFGFTLNRTLSLEKKEKEEK